jgi:hypothetical protein
MGHIINLMKITPGDRMSHSTTGKHTHTNTSRNKKGKLFCKTCTKDTEIPKTPSLFHGRHLSEALGIHSDFSLRLEVSESKTAVYPSIFNVLTMSRTQRNTKYHTAPPHFLATNVCLSPHKRPNDSPNLAQNCRVQGYPNPHIVANNIQYPTKPLRPLQDKENQAAGVSPMKRQIARIILDEHMFLPL